MIAVDTNVLARFYVDDPSDPEAVKSAARRDTPFTPDPARYGRP